jgi:hypothetical protein
MVEDYYPDILEGGSVMNLLLTTQSARVRGCKVCDIVYYFVDRYPNVNYGVMFSKLIARYQPVVGHDSSRAGV